MPRMSHRRKLRLRSTILYFLSPSFHTPKLVCAGQDRTKGIAPSFPSVANSTWEVPTRRRSTTLSPIVIPVEQGCPGSPRGWREGHWSHRRLPSRLGLQQLVVLYAVGQLRHRRQGAVPCRGAAAPLIAPGRQCHAHAESWIPQCIKLPQSGQ
ncbi:hypothetical protein LZ30DRAFT_12670 [Colletotrichum cereale]|nr:hypothetical protein LZ30DRAFT_12670 [Colletotrichum cereale]